MAEPAESFQKSSTVLGKKSDQIFENESLNLVEIEKGLHFFKGQCSVHVANRLFLRQKAYELVYNLYLKKGFTTKKESELWVSIYDALPDTTTFVAKDNNGRIDGALTVVFDSIIGLPADELYRMEIDGLRKSGAQLCEFVSLGISDSSKNQFKILASLFYCAYVLAWRMSKSTNLVVTVNPQHIDFYCQKILFKKIGPERSFAKVNGAPSVLLNVPLKIYSSLKHEQRIFPFFMINHSDQEEKKVADTIENMIRPLSDKEFYTFFIEKTDTWERAFPHQKDFIKKAYPFHNTNHNEVSRALASGFSDKSLDTDQKLNECKKAV